MVGLAQPLLAGRLPRRRHARPRRRPQLPTPTQGLSWRRRDVIRADRRDPPGPARCLAGGRDPAGLLRASGRAGGPLAGPGDRLRRGLLLGRGGLRVRRRRRQGQHPREGLARPEDRRGPEAAGGQAGDPGPVAIAGVARGHGADDVGRHLGGQAIPLVLACPTEAVGPAVDGPAPRAG